MLFLVVYLVVTPVELSLVLLLSYLVLLLLMPCCRLDEHTNSFLVANAQAGNASRSLLLCICYYVLVAHSIYHAAVQCCRGLVVTPSLLQLLMSLLCITSYALVLAFITPQLSTRSLMHCTP